MAVLRSVATLTRFLLRCSKNIHPFSPVESGDNLHDPWTQIFPGPSHPLLLRNTLGIPVGSSLSRTSTLEKHAPFSTQRQPCHLPGTPRPSKRTLLHRKRTQHYQPVQSLITQDADIDRAGFSACSSVARYFTLTATRLSVHAANTSKAGPLSAPQWTVPLTTCT